MTALFSNGRIVDFILALVIVEAVVLLTYRLVSGRGVPAAGLLTNLLAGSFLLLALRNALTESHWTGTATWLAAALVAHVADLSQRWRR
jgi:uncharacterized membrane protein YjjP (DUF1212 family)